MDLDVLKQTIIEFVRTHQAYAPFVLGLLTFGESFAFISLVLPTMSVLVAIGFAVAAADIPFWQAWLGAATGAALSSWLSYEIGGHLKTAAYDIWPLSRHPELHIKGERFFERFGPWAVFLGRFLGPTRAVIPLISGIFLMPPVLFHTANVASASVWAFVVLAPGAGLAQYLLW